MLYFKAANSHQVHEVSKRDKFVSFFKSYSGYNNMSIGNYSLVNLKQQESFSTSFLLDSCTHITDLKSGFYHLVSNGRGPITLRSNHSFNPYEIRLIPKGKYISNFAIVVKSFR